MTAERKEEPHEGDGHSGGGGGGTSISSSSSSTSPLPPSSPSPSPEDMLYCHCRHPILCKHCGQPHISREHTKKSIDHLIGGTKHDHDDTNTTTDNNKNKNTSRHRRPPLHNVFGNGPLLVSDIPKSARHSPTTQTNNSNNDANDDDDDDDQNQHGVVVGIDEAGRGSVLGPMVYGLAYWSSDPSIINAKIPKDFNDSKQLKDGQRSKLWNQIVKSDDIGFVVRPILPSEISRNMLRNSTDVYNLNEMSHDAAMVMIRKIVNCGIKVEKAYIDTVGHAGYYKQKLEREFPTIEFVVESKADAKYAPCSAASVVAKVMRDQMIEGWQYSEPGLEEGCANSELITKRQFGSGYPSDPACKQWMQQLHDPVFGFSDVVRFSWAPTKQRLSGEECNNNKNDDGTTSEDPVAPAVKVTFLADLDEDEEEDLGMAQGMAQFLNTSFPQRGGKASSSLLGTSKRKRSSYFDRRKIKVTKSIL